MKPSAAYGFCSNRAGVADAEADADADADADAAANAAADFAAALQLMFYIVNILLSIDYVTYTFRRNSPNSWPQFARRSVPP